MSWGKRLLMTGLVAIIGINAGLAQDASKIRPEIGAGTRYKVTQEHAEKAIMDLSLTSAVEDAWMYYKGELIDVGVDEDTSNVILYFPPTIQIDSGETIILYHNHTCPEGFSPPSIIDIVCYPLIKSTFKNNPVIERVSDNGVMWEYNLSDSLIHELEDKSRMERFKILESRINMVYNPLGKYKLLDGVLEGYSSDNMPKTVEEYVSLMKRIGVDAKIIQSKNFWSRIKYFLN